MMSLKNTGERQVGVEYRDIAPDHLKRYQLVRDTSGASASFVDIGCGVGYGTFLLGGRRGCTAVGYDVDLDTIQYARENWSHQNVSFWAGDVTRSEAVPSWPAIAVAFEIIEHLADPRPLLRAVQSPILWASVPNEEGNPWSQAKFPFHYRHYDQFDFRDLLLDTGWVIVEKWHQKTKRPGEIEDDWFFGARTLIVKATRESV